MRDSRGLLYSTALHGFLLVMLIVGLPGFLRPPAEPEPEAITVMLLPLSNVPNLPTADDAPKAPEQHEAQDIKQHEEVRAKQEEAPPPPPPPPKPHEVVKPPPIKKPPPKPKPKTPEDPLKSILEGIKTDAAKEGPKKTTKTTKEVSKQPSKSQHFDPGAPLSTSEKGAIIQQISDMWNAPAGAKNADTLVVPMHIKVERDGTITDRKFTGDQSRYASDPFYRAAVDAAMRAVTRASPLKNLPPEKYNVREGWSEIDIDFRPPPN